jgi:hypothetical protein
MVMGHFRDVSSCAANMQIPVILSGNAHKLPSSPRSPRALFFFGCGRAAPCITEFLRYCGVIQAFSWRWNDGLIR